RCLSRLSMAAPTPYREQSLHGVERLGTHDRLVLTIYSAFRSPDPAGVERIAEHPVEGAARDGLPAGPAAHGRTETEIAGQLAVDLIDRDAGEHALPGLTHERRPLGVEDESRPVAVV
ncbi:MAG TPA: hypothetical protein VMU11_02630, partial [Verrucomicrobiae bacterium]|nr:hypothetical protein [Verrucomicrobiae bacterium]